VKITERLSHVTSVKRLFVCLGVGVIALYFLMLLLLNSILLDRYYLRRATEDMEAAYQIVMEHPDGDFSAMVEIERRDVSIYLFDAESGELRYSSRSEDWLRAESMRELFVELCNELAQTDEPYRIVESETESVTSSGTEISLGQTMILYGRVDGALLELSLQLEPIREYAQIALASSLMLGLVVTLVAVLAFTCATRAITDPILAMSKTAEHIAQRDFSARCDDSYRSEFGTLARSINTMSDQLQEYTEELQDANDRLKQDIKAIDRAQRSRKDLVANLSHDLKTPLGLISGYADGLASGMAQTPEQVQEYCEVIQDECGRMRAMIQRMLHLSRIESGNITLNIETFCLSDLLDDLLASFRMEIERDGIHVTRDYEAGLYVVTDYISAEQSLMNYIQNAISHMGAGREMRLMIRPRPDGKLRVTVFNSAEPFSDEELGELWDSFYRGEKSRKRVGGHTGLGLAIVKGNMQLLGECCGVDNVPDGVAFWLELPGEQNTIGDSGGDSV
jgi:signal transduction histidine kinase